MRHGLDPGLSAPELFAIRRALAVETNPNHLVGFASAISADHPAAASLLYAKSALLELRPRVRQEALADQARHASERLSALLERASRGAWSGQRAIQWIAAQPIDAGSSLSSLVSGATGWSDAAQALKLASPPPIPWPSYQRLRAAADAAQALLQMRSHIGESPLHQAALSLAQPVDPRTNSLAATLQTLGFPDAYPLTAGLDLKSRVADFLRAVDAAQAARMPLRTALLLRRRAALGNSPLLERDVRRVASDLIVSPSAPLEDVAPAVRDLARALVLEVGPDIRVLDPAALRLVLRPQASSPQTIGGDRDRWIRVFHREAALDQGP